MSQPRTCDECGESLPDDCCEYGHCVECCRCEDGPGEAQIGDVMDRSPAPAMLFTDQDTLGRGGLQ